MHPLLLFTLLFLPGIRTGSSFFEDSDMLEDPYDYDWSSKPLAFEEADYISDDKEKGLSINIPRKDNAGIHGAVEYYTTKIDEKGNTVPNGYVYKSFAYGSNSKPNTHKNKMVSSTSFQLNYDPLTSVSFGNHLSQKKVDKLNMKHQVKNNLNMKNKMFVSTDKKKPILSSKTPDFGHVETTLSRPFLMNDFGVVGNNKNFGLESHIVINSGRSKKVKKNIQEANKGNQLYSDKPKTFSDNLNTIECDCETSDSDFMDSEEFTETENKASHNFVENKSVKKDLSSDKIKDGGNSRQIHTFPKRTSDYGHHLHFGKKIMDAEVENELEESKHNSKLDDFSNYNNHVDVFNEDPFMKAEKTQNRLLKDVKRNLYGNNYKNDQPENETNDNKNSAANNNGELNLGFPHDSTKMPRFDEIRPLTTPAPPTTQPALATPVLKKPNHSHLESTTPEYPRDKNSISNEINQNNNEISGSSSKLTDVINQIKKILRM